LANGGQKSKASAPLAALLAKVEQPVKLEFSHDDDPIGTHLAVRATLKNRREKARHNFRGCARCGDQHGRPCRKQRGGFSYAAKSSTKPQQGRLLK
jgi:hypothetical protein